MSIIVLADANNFYASCERVFNPRLHQQPLVVLSNGDGCVIARSNEAKALGIKMGQPLFHIKDQIRRHKVHLFSSNFELYGDMSRRMMNLLRHYTPRMEIYSIDEAFLDLTGISLSNMMSTQAPLTKPTLTLFAQHLRQMIYQGLGLPISLGLGPTKALAKIANHLVKKNPHYDGVLDLTGQEDLTPFLQQVAIENVWGVGRRLAPTLRRHDITTAYDLREVDVIFIRKIMGIGGVKLVQELRGLPRFNFQDQPDPKKSLTVSRTFAASTDKYDKIQKAVAYFTVRCGEKLRAQGLKTQGVGIYLRTNRFNNDLKTSDFSLQMLKDPTDLTPVLLKASLRLLHRIYRSGYRYNKAGVLLAPLTSPELVQLSLFDGKRQDPRQQILSQSIDGLNRRFGSETVIYGVQGLVKAWQPTPRYRSPRYTTRWSEIPHVWAK